MNSMQENKKINFLSAMKICFEKYADFSGRASRPEFWYFVLFVVMVGILFSALKLHMAVNIFGFVTTLPAVAVTVRRFRDAGISIFLLVPFFLVQIVDTAYIVSDFSGEEYWIDFDKMDNFLAWAIVLLGVIFPLIACIKKTNLRSEPQAGFVTEVEGQQYTETTQWNKLPEGPSKKSTSHLFIKTMVVIIIVMTIGRGIRYILSNE